MVWCKHNLQDTLGRDIEDKLASLDNGNGANGNGATDSVTERTRH
jgi:hypothetical protein